MPLFKILATTLAGWMVMDCAAAEPLILPIVTGVIGLARAFNCQMVAEDFYNWVGQWQASGRPAQAPAPLQPN